MSRVGFFEWAGKALVYVCLSVASVPSVFAANFEITSSFIKQDRRLDRFENATKCTLGASICPGPGGKDRSLLATDTLFQIGTPERTGVVGIRLPGASKVKLTGSAGETEIGFSLIGYGGVYADRFNSFSSFRAGTSCTNQLTNSLGGPSFLFQGKGCLSRSPAILNAVISGVFFEYELTAPADSSRLKPGEYRGRLVYTVGVGREIDYMPASGSNPGRAVSDTSDMVIDFKLTVPLIFEVEVPAGGNKIELTPEEGWQRWLQQGRKPTRLVKNQTFNISSNSKFSMRLQCSDPGTKSCSLKKVGGTQTVPVDVNVTLPGNFTSGGGQRVVAQRLSETTSSVFNPSRYQERLPGNLQFVVAEQFTSEMLKDAGSEYKGTVTVIWESQI